MPHMIVKCPDGKFAQWSSVADGFLEGGMTYEEAEIICYSEVGFLESICWVQRALLFPERYTECVDTIEAVYGQHQRALAEEELRWAKSRVLERYSDHAEVFTRLRSLYTGLYLCPQCSGKGSHGRGGFDGRTPCASCNQTGWIR
jgi:hypothetical protein